MANKKVLIIGGVVALTGLVFFLIPPKAKVVIRKDGSGKASLGGSTKNFTTEKGVDISTPLKYMKKDLSFFCCSFFLNR